MKKFSIVIPIYNVEKYIDKCLKSIVDQTFDMSKVQVILINDGSSDRSGDICKEYYEKYDFFEYHFIPRGENSGLGNARNFGTSLVKAEYFLYLDSDDYYEKNALEVLNDNVDNCKEANLVIFDYKRVYENQTLLQKFYQPNQKQTKHFGKLTKEAATKISHCPWNKVFKTSVHSNFRFSNELYEDIALTVVMLNEEKTLVIEDVLINYLVRADSQMTQKFKLKKVTQNIVNFEEIEKDINPEYIQEFYYRFIKYGYIFSIFTLSKEKQYKQLFSQYLTKAQQIIKEKQIQKYLSFTEKIFFVVMNIKNKF